MHILKVQLKSKRSAHDILVFYIKEIYKSRHYQRDMAPHLGEKMVEHHGL